MNEVMIFGTFGASNVILGTRFHYKSEPLGKLTGCETNFACWFQNPYKKKNS